MKPEMAFVVSMDYAGFSLLPLEQKPAPTSALRSAILASSAYAQARDEGDVIALDTGDGAILVFFGDPTTAARVAVDIDRAINTPGNSLRLRIGVHTGPVLRRTDVDGKPSVDGQGIEIAVRVASVADGSAILASDAYAQVLAAFSSWQPCLGRPFEREVKHGARIRVYPVGSACSEPAAAPAARGKPEGLELAGISVALSYKRHAEPDAALLRTLEEWLVAQGCSVFVDRHMSIGVEWANEIERKMRGGDAVIVLLSDRACDSEMILYEVQIARDERDQTGKPILLPVRIGADRPVGGEIGALLRPFQYFRWSGPQDDVTLKAEIAAALRRPAAPAIDPAAIEQPGGAVPLGSPFYVERASDADYQAALARRDSIILVKGARQMGKTSLLARGIQSARDRGWRVVTTDFQTLSSSQLDTDERLYKSLMYGLSSQLGLKANPADHWNDWLGANTNLEDFIEGVILPGSDAHLVWAIDEADRLFSRPYATDFFGMVRSWHNRRALDPGSRWSGLTIALAYATEAHLFISDLNQSPLNVGTRLTLGDFTREQVLVLNERYGSPIRGAADLARIYALLSGQPYLTRRALDELARGAITLDELVARSGLDEGIFGDHLRRLVVVLTQDPQMHRAVRSLLAGERLAPDAFFRLRAGGLITGDTNADARFRCAMYEGYMRRHLAA